MTDRIVKVLEQGKFVLRGIQKTGNNPILALDSDETLDVNFDWSTWLGSDTIASVANEVTGVTIASATNDTTTASFNVSGSYSGYVEHRITTAAGLTKEVMLFVYVDDFPVSDDYGLGWRL